MKTLLLSTAIFGIALGIVVRFASGPGAEPIARILTLGILGVVPLAVLVTPAGSAAWNRLRAIVAVALPLGGIPAVISLWLPTGTAGFWVAPWVSVTLLVACLGLGRLFGNRGWADASSFCAGAAFVFLPVGAAWLVMSRMGLRPMGFTSVIVVLTAVHFHFAALAAPMWASRLIGSLEPGPLRRVASGAGIAIIVAVPIVALGISVSDLVALVGTGLLAGALMLLASLALGWGRKRVQRPAARWLLVISAISLLLSMPLAIVYQLGLVLDVTWIDLEWMVRLHGFANAHGFATCGLLAWALEDRAQAAQSRENESQKAPTSRP